MNSYGVDTIFVDFMMYHDTAYPSSADQISVQVSTDGTTWATMGTIQRYDGTTGWASHTVDISAYAMESTVYVGFLATSGYGSDVFMDDIEIYAPGQIVEYDQTVTGVTVNIGEVVDVVFPDWTPADWQVANNVDIDYLIDACTLLADNNSDNDCADKLITLHYGFLHDIEIVSIDSPTESGPATEDIPVEVTIKNMGAFPECCFFVNTQIGQTVYNVDGFFSNFEADNGGFTVTGSVWAWGEPTSGPGAAYSGAKLWATNLGGDYPANTNTQLTTTAVTVPTDGDLTFWHWWDTEESYDGGNVKISTNGGSTWTLITPLSGYTGTANSLNPLYPEPIFSGHEQGFWEQMTFDLAAYEGMSVMFRFDFGSDGSVQYPGWYFDDILVGSVEITIVQEYNESRCIPDGGFIEPGEELTLEYPDWTPAHFLTGLSASIEYTVFAESLLSSDNNPDNDLMQVDLVLDFWHDVQVAEVGLPTDKRDDPIFVQSPTDPSGAWSFYTSAAGGPHLVQEDFYGLTDPIGAMTWWGLPLIWTGSGWSQGTGADMVFEIIFYEDDAGAPGDVVATFSDITMSGVATGQSYSGYLSYVWEEVELPSSVSLETGWFSIQTTDSPEGAWILLQNSLDGNLNAIQNGGALADNIAIELFAGSGGGQPGADIFAQPGVYTPEALMKNLGTYAETGLTSYAYIYEYILNPNGTLVYTDSVDGIDLDPLGGEASVSFSDYDFMVEGIYGLVVNLQLGNDDYPNNNIKTIGIGIDDSAPTSSHVLDPATPTGLNGWYVSDVTVTINGDDGSQAYQSGVDHIEYRIDGGAWQTIPNGGSFDITTDGTLTIDYKAVDGVGNEEAVNSFGLNMDQTGPAIDLLWEAVGGLSDDILFTAQCDDVDSGMDFVEFYINNILQHTDDAAPYEWILTYVGGIQFTVTAIAYDLAGNTAEDSLTSGEGVSVNVQTTPTPLIK
jgi:hypothetical protein